MPNWCDNSIYIESDEETIAEIKLAIKAGAQAINSATVQTFDPRAVETQS